MRISVRYLAQARRAAGRAAEDVQTEAASAQELLRDLARRHGDPLRGLLLAADGGLRPSMLFFLGDAQVEAGGSTPLRDGDVLTVLAPMAGG